MRVGAPRVTIEERRFLKGVVRMSRRVLSAGVLAIALFAGSACSSAQSAVDAGTSALDAAQGIVDGASGLVGAAADIAAACSAAAAAWVPGISGSEARAAIDEGLALARQGLAENPSLPGAEGVVSALEDAQASLADPGSSIGGVSDSLLTTACGIFMAG